MQSKIRNLRSELRNPAPLGPRPSSPGPSAAFTLVELLVVVAIIVILIAILTPSLEKALAAAQKAKCLANEHGQGNALALYLTDYNRTYPVVQNWADLMGSLGNTTWYNSHVYDSDVRPLNRYLGIEGKGAFVASAQCPSDTGDFLVGVPNAFDAFGTSYIAMLDNVFRFDHVVGWAADLAALPSVKSTQLQPTQNKVILADWPVHGNRLWKDRGNRWHDNGSKDVRQFNTLFADGHSEWFTFAVLDMEEKNYGYDNNENTYMPGNPSWRWW